MTQCEEVYNPSIDSLTVAVCLINIQSLAQNLNPLLSQWSSWAKYIQDIPKHFHVQ